MIASLAAALGTTANARPDDPGILTKVPEIRSLSKEQAARGLPVRVRGIVTVRSGWRNSFFFLSNGVGISVDREDLAPEVLPGDQVEISGVTGPGRFAPIIVSRHIVKLGQQPRPAAPLRHFDDLIGGSEDSQWVAVRGIVHGVSIDQSWGRPILVLNVEMSGGSIAARILNFKQSDAQSLVDAEIRVTGVCGTNFNDRGQYVGLRLFAESVSEILVERPAAPDPFSIPAAALDNIMPFGSGKHLLHRVKVEGIVTYQQPGRSLYIQHEGHGLYVETDSPILLPLGVRVQVVGFPVSGPYSPILQSGLVRVVGVDRQIEPVTIDAAQVISKDSAGFSVAPYNGVLVQLPAVLVEKLPRQGGELLLLRDGGIAFRARLEDTGQESHPSVREDSRVSLTGVCAVRTDENREPYTFELELRGPSDIAIVEGPPWWNVKHVLQLLAAALLSVIAATAWITMLRRRVRIQTGQINQHLATVNLLNSQLEQRIASRTAELERTNLRLQSEIAEREQIEDKLRVAQRLESLGRLAGGVAHDFNNLLGVVLGQVELLLERGGDRSQFPALQMVKDAALRGASLTAQLLAFGRQQVLAPVVLDVNAVLSGMEALLRRMLFESIELEFRVSPQACPICADPTQLEQVILNLAINARDAMPAGGKLTFCTACALDDSSTHPDIVPPGHYVQLTVSDTGSGMDLATKTRIFEPFFSTKEPGKGTGLGLATVYGIVKQSGGYIWVYSEVGLGTVFKLYFPAAAGAPVQKHQPADDSEPLPGKRETILIVEDDPDLREVTAQFLQSGGYHVLTAGSPQQALDLAKQFQQPIDLLVTDMVMPGMNGRQLASSLFATRPELNVLYVSGYDQYLVKNGGPAALENATAFLQKPFNRKALLRKVRDLMDSRHVNAVEHDVP